MLHGMVKAKRFTESVKRSLYEIGQIGLLVLGLSVLVFGQVCRAETGADSAVTNSAPAQVPQRSQKKSTELSFDDVLVQGKFHFSDEAVTTVEDDKFLDALLTVRKDFKDRIKKSSSRH